MVLEGLMKFCLHVLMEIKMEGKWRTVRISGDSVCSGERNSSNTGCKKHYTCDETVFQPVLSLWNHQTNGSESRRIRTVCVDLRTCVSGLDHWFYEHTRSLPSDLFSVTQLVSTWINRSFLCINVYLIKLQFISPLQGLGPLCWS